jgi:hypothetical protein
MAHTDHERATMEQLESCRLHLWIIQTCEEMPVRTRGWYIMKAAERDPTSESFPSDACSYVFEPIVVQGDIRTR